MREQKRRAVRCWESVLVGAYTLSHLCGSTVAYAQAKMPTELIGGWCGVGLEGESVDITDYSLDEGYDACELKKLRSDHSDNSAIYELTMSCKPIVERPQTRIVTETFRVLQLEKPYMLRAGDMYDSKNLRLYKRC
jgi:hypothetical protein